MAGGVSFRKSAYIREKTAALFIYIVLTFNAGTNIIFSGE